MPPKTSTQSNQSAGVTSSSGYLLTCDPPMKQFIIHLNDKKSADKKFILEDLDATHLLIKGDVRDEITRKVDEWMDEVSTLSDTPWMWNHCFIVVMSKLLIIILRFAYF